MTTFSKSSIRRFIDEKISATPGPNTYSNSQSSLLNQNPNKHYGFLEKSERFQTNKDDAPDHFYDDSSSRPVSVNSYRNIQREQKYEREEINRLKKESQRMEENYQKQFALQEKDVKHLTDRINRMDSQYQNAIKERNTLLSTGTAKEKEISDLQRKISILRSNMEKIEKTTTSYHEKQLRSEVLQKKVEVLERQNDKTKSLTEKKLSQENETLLLELRKAKKKYESNVAKREQLLSNLSSITEECKITKMKHQDLSLELQKVKNEWISKEAKLKEEAKELNKRYLVLENKFQSQKTEFSSTIQTLNSKCDEYKQQMESNALALDRQKQAYLARINQLETDLEITERSLMEKDKELEVTRSQYSSVKLTQENELKETISSLEARNLDFARLENEFATEKQENADRLSTMRKESENLQLELDQDRNRYEQLILTLESSIEQYRIDSESSVKHHNNLMESKECIIRNITQELEASRAETNLKSSEISILSENFKKMKDQLENSVQVLIDENNVTVSDFQSSMERKDTQILEYQTQIQNAELESVAFRQLVAEKDLELTTLRKQFGSTSTEASTKVLELQKQIEIITKKFETEIAEKQALQQSSDSKVIELEQKILELEATIIGLEGERTRVQLNLDQKNQEIESLTKNFEMNQLLAKEEIQVLKERLQIACDQYQNLTSHNDALHRAHCADSQALKLKIQDLESQLTVKNSSMTMIKQLSSETLFEVENNRKSEVDQFQKEIANLKEDVLGLKTKLQNSIQENEALNDQFREVQETSDSLKTFHRKEKSALETQIAQLKFKNSEKDSANQTLRDRVAEISRELNEEKSKNQLEKSNHKQIQVDLKHWLDESNSEIKGLQTRLEEEKSKLAECDVETKMTKEQLFKAKNGMKLKEVELLSVKEELDSCKKKLQTAHEEVDTISGSSTYFETNLKEQKRVTKEVEDQLHNIRKLKVSLEDQLNEANRLVKTEQTNNQHLRIQNENLQQKLSIKIQELESAQTTYRLEVDKFQLTIEEKNTDIQKLEERQLTLNNQNSQTEMMILSLKEEIIEHQQTIYSKDQEIERLLSKEKDLHLQIENLNSKVKLSTETYDSTKEKLLISESLITELQKELVKVKSSLTESENTLAKVCADKDTEIQELIKSKNSLFTKINSQNDEIEEIMNKLHAKQLEISKISLTIKEESANRMKIENESKIKVNQLKDEIISLEACNSDYQIQLSSLNEEKKLLIMQKDVISKQLENSLLEATKNNSQLQTSLDKISELQSELLSRNSDYNLLENKTRELEVEFQKKTEEHAEDINTLNNLISEKEQSIREGSDKILELEEFKKFAKVRFEDDNQKLEAATQMSNQLVSESNQLKQDLATNKQLFLKERAALELHINTLLTEQESRKQESIANTNEINRIRTELSNVQNLLENEKRDTSLLISNLNSTKLKLEVQLQEEKQNADKEKLQLLHNAMSERTRLENSISSKEMDLKNIEDKLKSKEDELNRIRHAAKSEFASLEQKNLDQTLKSQQNSKAFESTVQELSKRLAESLNSCKLLETELADAKSTINRFEMKLTNETSSRDLLNRTLEGKLRERTKTIEKLETTISKISAEKEKMLKESKQLLQKKVETELRKGALAWEEEKISFMHEKAILEDQLETKQLELDRLTVELEQVQQNYDNEKELYNSQLQILEIRGNLQSNEVKKIGEMNAELFGHSNNRQKIKHLAQLKEENVNLKTQNLKISRERDNTTRKLMNLERELDTYKAVGSTQHRKSSKLGRSFQQDGNQLPEDFGMSNSSMVGEDEEKENMSITISNMTSGMSGISFLNE